MAAIGEALNVLAAFTVIFTFVHVYIDSDVQSLYIPLQLFELIMNIMVMG